MNTKYLEQARERIANVPLLINVVSRRVRQLISGQRPLVKPDHPHMEYMDIALKEIAENKLTAEMTFAEAGAAEEDETTAEARKVLSL